MCGIVGLFGQEPQKQALLTQACQAIRYRGPDSQGFWENASQGIALGHVRLAIQDLTESGHQPMLSHNKRYCMVFNGEVYNHYELRDQLKKEGYEVPWQGHSDTETILAYIQAKGLKKTVQALVGMFAIALWDQDNQTLSLVRDRFGEKPLYYGWFKGHFAFASEIKALQNMPHFNHRINRDAIALLLRHNYIPAPYSVYEQLFKLKPGHVLTLNHQQLLSPYSVESQAYWSASEMAHQPESAILTDEQAIEQYECLLKRSIKGQMLADVQLGAFLSSGTDSSLIVALMQSMSEQAIKTFTIGFEEKAYDEAPAAQAIARHLGTDHQTLYVSAQEGLGLIERLPAMYDEPFADSSQIPTAMVMKLARQVVTVALSGDAGDELLGGYSRYQRALAWYTKLQKMPTLMKKGTSMVSRLAQQLFPHQDRTQALAKLNRCLQARQFGTFYKEFVSYWSNPSQIVLGSHEPKTVFGHTEMPDLLSTMMVTDTVSYLLDDILVKVDRAAMAYSLETRVPMLDHRLYEWLWTLPMHFKVRDGQSKWLSKQLLHRYVPASLLDHPKKGFSAPIGAWLRGPLKDWASDLLSVDHLKQQGLLNAQEVNRCWQTHLSGRQDKSAHLWGILMLQMWLNEYKVQV